MWLALKTGKMIPILQATKSVTNISISFTLMGSAFYHNYSKTMVYIELKKKNIGFCLTHKAYDFFRPGKASLTMTVPSSTKNSSFTPWDFKYAAICFAPSIPRTFLKINYPHKQTRKDSNNLLTKLSLFPVPLHPSLCLTLTVGGGGEGEKREREGGWEGKDPLKVVGSLSS